MALVAALAVGACGDDAPPMPMDAAVRPSLASLAQLVAFEGHRTHVNEITLPDGASLEGARVSAEPPLEVVEQACVPARCGVVLRILDAVPNRGVGVPSPIDATNHFLQVTLASGEVYRALLSVQPLDALSNGAGNQAMVTQPVVLASGLRAEAGSEFVAAAATPIRWVVFGDATMQGTFTLTPSAEGPRGGGGQGGAPGAPGGGPGGGGAGSGGAGGGGGAGTEPGAPGQGADGTPGEGGAGGTPTGEPTGACLSDFSRDDCAGGGGGGGAGQGGHGGGGLLLVALGDLRMDGGVVDVSGGGATDGGGGGGAGQVLLAGSGSVAPPELRTAGGVAASPGGDGGDSVPRVDGVASLGGVRLEVAGFEPLVRSATLHLEGQAEEGAMEIRVAGIRRASADVVDGSFAVDVPLEPGLNRLQLVWVRSAGETRVWVGNGIELGSVDGSAQPLPTGATLDVVYLAP